MNDPTLPGSAFFDTLQSKEFEQALKAGFKEALDCKDFGKGVECFNYTAQKNGLDLKITSAILVEMAKAGIRAYFEEQKKKSA